MELLLYGLVGSVFSLIGGLVVIWRAEQVKKIMTPLLAFAAAAFLAVSFLDLLPEAIESVTEPHFVFISFLVGICIFFALERILMKYFHHHAHGEAGHDDHTESLPALIILGDSLHNFLDGIAMAIAFIANPALGLTTALAIAAHEIPQEIGDFAILLDQGWSKKKVILANLFSALTAFLGIFVGYTAISFFENTLPYLLGGVSGIFAYIALSDLIPEVHHRAHHKYVSQALIPFILGLLAIGYLISLTH